jgi:hypothetical protein
MRRAGQDHRLQRCNVHVRQMTPSRGHNRRMNKGSIVALACLIAGCSGVSVAQPVAPRASSADARFAVPAYQSAFRDYRRFADQPVLPWDASNQLVERIGGWQAYARESQGAAVPSAGVPAKPDASRSPPAGTSSGPANKPTASGQSSGDHATHH